MNIILKKWHLQSRYQSTSMDFIEPYMFIKIYLNENNFKSATMVIYVDGNESKILKNQ